MRLPSFRNVASIATGWFPPRTTFTYGVAWSFRLDAEWDCEVSQVPLKIAFLVLTCLSVTEWATHVPFHKEWPPSPCTGPLVRRIVDKNGHLPSAQAALFGKRGHSELRLAKF